MLKRVYRNDQISQILKTFKGKHVYKNNNIESIKQVHISVMYIELRSFLNSTSVSSDNIL